MSMMAISTGAIHLTMKYMMLNARERKAPLLVISRRKNDFGATHPM